MAIFEITIGIVLSLIFVATFILSIVALLGACGVDMFF